MKEDAELPSYFCVTVSNLPDNITEKELKQYMEQFGEVKEIAEVRNYD